MRGLWGEEAIWRRESVGRMMGGEIGGLEVLFERICGEEAGHSAGPGKEALSAVSCSE